LVSDSIALVIPLYVQFGGEWALGTNPVGSDYKFGIGSGLGAKFFFKDAFTNSFYIQPVATVGYLGLARTSDIKTNNLQVGGSLIVGYSSTLESGLNLNIGIGPGVTYLANDNTLSVYPDLEASIGYAW
jgi:hypothetical protein